MTLEGLEVLLLQPDFASPPRLVGSQKVDTAELGEARRINAYIGDHPLHAFTHRFKLTSVADRKTLEDFITDRAGRWQPFWLPSWHGELNPVATIADGSDQLSITPVNYATVYDPTHANPARIGHYIFLIHYDGTFLVRKVESVTGTSPEVLTLDAPVTREFALGQFAVGFVYCVSLIADRLTFQFSGIGTASIELAVAEENSIDATAVDDDEPDLEDLLVADFDTDVASGDPPLTVEFTDISEGTPIAWLWNFGDGSATTTTQNPTHEFTESGTYNVTLTVTDANGNTSSVTHTIVVNDEPPPPDDVLTAEFSFDPAGGDAALAVDFTDETVGTPTVWYWTFGDGSYSTEQNPSHTFSLPGVYTIVLSVRDTNGATSKKVDTITVTEATVFVTTCDTGEDFGPPGWVTSCLGSCSFFTSANIGDIDVWITSQLANCVGLSNPDGKTFEILGKTFAVAYNPALNYGDGGSFNPVGEFYYDVVRIA